MSGALLQELIQVGCLKRSNHTMFCWQCWFFTQDGHRVVTGSKAGPFSLGPTCDSAHDGCRSSRFAALRHRPHLKKIWHWRWGTEGISMDFMIQYDGVFFSWGELELAQEKLDLPRFTGFVRVEGWRRSNSWRMFTIQRQIWVWSWAHVCIAKKWMCALKVSTQLYFVDPALCGLEREKMQ